MINFLKIFFLLILLSLLQPCSAKKIKFIDNIYKKIEETDTTYIRKSNKFFTAGITNSNWLELYKFKIDDININMRTDFSTKIGPTLGYKGIMASYLINIPNFFTGKYNNDYLFNLGINFGCFNFEITKLTDNNEKTITGYGKMFKAFDNANILFNGLKMTSFEIKADYFFNRKKYSNSAAYSNSKNITQIKNSGSLITGFSYQEQIIDIDFTELKTDITYEDLGSQHIESTNYCIDIGYGYNFVITKRILANLTIIPSFGLKRNKIKNNEENYIKNNYQSSIKGLFKCAIDYRWARYFACIKMQYNANLFFTNKYSLISAYTIINFTIGGKF